MRGRLHECADKADTPRLRPKRASASIPLSGRSFGEAQDIPREPLRQPGVHRDGDVVIRDKR